MHAAMREDHNAVRQERLLQFRFYFSKMQSLKLYLEVLTL